MVILLSVCKLILVNQQCRLTLEFILDLNFQFLSNYFGAFLVLLGQFVNSV